LECPIGTVRSRLHRGRALLLAKLEMLREAPKRANAVR
jgi:DNA-directed RNA polymerase specialized sigma24 family protein